MASRQAVLFEKVRGSKIRVACNIIATPRRFYLALGGSSHKSHEEEVKKNIHSRVSEALNALSEPTRTEGGGLFEENSSTSLYDLPIVTHFEKDAGSFIRSSIVFQGTRKMTSRTSRPTDFCALMNITWQYAW